MRLHLNLEVETNDPDAWDDVYTTGEVAAAACKAVEGAGLGIVSAHWHQVVPEEAVTQP